MLAAVLNPSRSSTECEVWDVIEDEAFIARYSGNDIVVGLTRDELQDKLRQRYPTEEHYERVFGDGYSHNGFKCTAEAKLKDSPEALEVAKDKARAGAIVNLGKLGWQIYGHDDTVHGDDNVSAIVGGFVLDHSGSEYMLRYDPELADKIRQICERRKQREQARRGRREGCAIGRGVRHGQICYWTINSFLDDMRSLISDHPLFEGLLWNYRGMWVYPKKPKRLNGIKKMFAMLRVLERLYQRPHVYRTIKRPGSEYKFTGLSRLLDEAEVALPALKKAIRDFRKDWQPFAFVTGIWYADDNLQYAQDARRTMSRFARWLEHELEHSSRGARRRSRVHVQRRGQKL
ncbi:MAG: hypothetical protein ABFE07_29235 [Armatimonadia bacterium]